MIHVDFADVTSQVAYESPERIGRYEVDRRIGRGGMGSVYLARDPVLGRTVAIKILSVRGHDEDRAAELRLRFAREARAAAALAHQHIVTVFDVGEHDGSPFMAMEYVEGETMAAFIARGAPVATIQKLQMVLELCSGLSYAHRAGLVHRDIKPANVMITSAGAIKILDFGLARLVDDAANAGLTQSGVMLGTPHYMSPEQVEGRPADQRSDIFAVGAVLYELLSCQKAFPGDSFHSVLYKIVHADPTPIRELCPGIDADLEAVVHAGIAKAPDQRYQTLAAMSDDLTQVHVRLSGAMDATVIVSSRTPPSLAAAPGSSVSPASRSAGASDPSAGGSGLPESLYGHALASGQPPPQESVQLLQQAATVRVDGPQQSEHDRERRVADTSGERAPAQAAAGAATRLRHRVLVLGVVAAALGIIVIVAAMISARGGRVTVATDLNADVTRADAAYASGQTTDAIDLALRVLAQDPDHQPALRLLERARADASGGAAEARSDAIASGGEGSSRYAEAVAAQSQADAIVDIRDVARALGLYSTAERLYRSAVPADTDTPGRWLERARAEYQAGRTETAVEHAMQGLALDARHTDTLEFLNELRAAAQRETAQRRTAAVRAGADEKSSQPFRDGVAAERQAAQLSTLDQTHGALAAHRRAQAAFDVAAAGAGRDAARPRDTRQEQAVGRVEELLAQRDFAAARTTVDTWERSDPGNQAARELRDRIAREEQGWIAQQKLAEEAQAIQEQIAQALRVDDLETRGAALEAATRRYPESGELRTLLQVTREAIAARQRPSGPVPPAQAIGRAELIQVLNAYAAAYASLAEEQFRSIYPSVTARRLGSLNTSRQACRAYEVTIDESQLEASFTSDGRAIVDVPVRYACNPRAGPRPPPLVVDEQMTIQRVDGRLVIVAMAER